MELASLNLVVLEAVAVVGTILFVRNGMRPFCTILDGKILKIRQSGYLTIPPSEKQKWSSSMTQVRIYFFCCFLSLIAYLLFSFLQLFLGLVGSEQAPRYIYNMAELIALYKVMSVLVVSPVFFTLQRTYSLRVGRPFSLIESVGRMLNFFSLGIALLLLLEVSQFYLGLSHLNFYVVKLSVINGFFSGTAIFILVLCIVTIREHFLFATIANLSPLELSQSLGLLRSKNLTELDFIELSNQKLESLIEVAKYFGCTQGGEVVSRVLVNRALIEVSEADGFV